MTANNRLLQFVHFADIVKWSANVDSLNQAKSEYPLVPLSKILKRRKDAIAIEDNCFYRRITVRLYGMGVHQRDKVIGKDIGTKKQFIAHAGQLIISRIDARNGAFGIVPDELDGAIVTNDFWLFDVTDALPQYIVLILASELFQKHWQTQSSGTTNRQRVDEQEFLASRIALPVINIQNAILDRYNYTNLQASIIEEQIKTINTGINDYLMRRLNVTAVSIPNVTSKLRTVQYKDLPNRWEWDNLTEAINKSLANSYFPIKHLHEFASFVNRGWNKVSIELDSFMYIEIGGINTEDNIAVANKNSVSNAPSRATQTVRQGDLIIGTTRPYLKRFALIHESEDGFVCSSGFQVIERKPTYDNRYVLEVLKIDPTIRQFESLMTGALYPAVNSAQLTQIRIPLPPVEIQKEIADNIDLMKIQVYKLRRQADGLRQYAKKQFEEAVFGVVNS